MRVGQAVEVHDPLGYSGHGEIRKIQTQPHEAVLVLMHSITDRTDQSKVGEEVWVLTGHVTPINRPSLAEREREARNSSKTDPSWRTDYEQ